MKRLLLMVFAIIAVFGGVMAVSAQEGSPSENACYTGGEMEGKCDWPTEEESKWAWNCGWYYAGLKSGRIPLSEYPAACGGSTETAGCAINDVFENNPEDPTFTVLPPGVLANDSNCSEVVSYSTPEVLEGGKIISFTLYIDGGFDYEVSDPGTVFTFTYTTENGSTATVIVYHDMDCECSGG